jgi:TPR repeat protein
VHARSGVSIANGTFTVLLANYRTPVEHMHVEAVKEEAQLAGERESEARANEDLGVENFSRRPTAGGYRYCGLDEFQGKSYICRIKNRDQRCPDFAPGSAEASRSCGTCANLVRPSEPALTEIERCMGQLEMTGRDELLQRIRTTLESRAPLEYQSCLQGAGIMSLRPGFLPWCTAWSEDEGTVGSPGRFVVGPVVNVGNDCDRWQRAESDGLPEDAELQRLVAQFQDQNGRAAGALGVVQQLQNETFPPRISSEGFPMLIDPAEQMDADVQGWGGVLQWAGRWAAIELITFCLKLLGADASFMTSVSDALRRNLPPHMGDRSDDEWIAWLRWQQTAGEQGKRRPGLRYLANIAPWQQWCAQMQAEPNAAEERTRVRMEGLEKLRGVFPSEQQAGERMQQYETAEADDEDSVDEAADGPRAGDATLANFLANLAEMRESMLRASQRAEAERDALARAANAGDIGAMFNLGLLLKDSDPGQARQWLERAAEAGHDDAMFNLGLMLEDGDPEAARAWYERAAEAGDSASMWNLGLLLNDSDPEQAREWYERAAEAGDSDDMFNLAVRLDDSDPEQARAWYERAAEAGHDDAMFNLGVLLKDSDPEQAREWLERAAEAGHDDAMFNLGLLLKDSDPEAARQWYERAAEAGDIGAMFNLGLLLKDGDPEAAREWYERAAAAGHNGAMCNLGVLYHFSDSDLAREWYEQAAEAGHSGAMGHLGALLEDGDPAAAREWYERAAEAGNSGAMADLGRLLEDDDPAASREWYERAVEAGD